MAIIKAINQEEFDGFSFINDDYGKFHPSILSNSQKQAKDNTPDPPDGVAAPVAAAEWWHHVRILYVNEGGLLWALSIPW